MSTVSDAIRAHHRELMGTLAEQAWALADDRPDADPDRLLGFLKRELLPHALGEERQMYPVLDSLIKQRGRPTETMRIDHQAIEDYTNQIERLVQALPTASNAELPELEKRLKRVALQLEAVFALHMHKEEEAFLPLFEQSLTDEEQRKILDGMHEVTSELDVRHVPHSQRHSLIFDAFAQLAPGASFALVNDHDPKPLYHQFKAQRGDGFSWEYLEQGPTVWRVRIGKVA